ncbi:MAG: LuxR family transcriptional regulator [Pseudomonadota bacterium]
MQSDTNITYLNADHVEYDRLIMSASSEFELLNLCARVAQFYGLPWYSITRIPSDDDKRLESLGIVSNWPEKLITEYDRLKLFESSPIIEHLKTSEEPIFFDNQELHKDRPDKKDDDAILLFDKFGMNHGVYFCVQNTKGEVAAVSFGGPDNITDREVFTKLYFYANLVYSRLSVLRTKDDASFFDLKPRELEFMQLVSKGCSLAEISAKSGLSEKAVETYLTNAAMKLGCETRIHAVSKALRLNLIR